MTDPKKPEDDSKSQSQNLIHTPLSQPQDKEALEKQRQIIEEREKINQELKSKI